ncbi:hypothetical protein IV203_008171 [Nitzschia inconspicua]|uniref:Uncharacterized protein n=1 Tax=Nitzschia inconspicua TaxID=303405 RepID=A0A9K3PLW7_9STRA|nr:hypothetical protein IV203_008171 [Nitzschia inconspicua]
MAPSLFNVILCVASLSAGIWAFVTTQAVTKDQFQPIITACTSPNFEESGYHRYDKRVGLVALDFLVCLITQFMVDLTTMVPMGLLTWGTTILGAIPATMVMMLEANRKTNSGLLKWPVAISLLGQLFGISVIFPAVWVPSYVFFAAKESGGAVNGTLARSLVVFVLPPVFLTIALFTLDVQSDAWTTCAGILGGPIICFLGLAPTLLSAPDNATNKQVAQASRTSAISFGIGGLISTCGWFYMLYVVYLHFGTDLPTLFQAVWTEAHPSIKFMSVDASILWMGLVFHIATRKLSSAVEAVVLTPLFGPGGACCMALASLESDRAAAQNKGTKKE